MATTTFIDGSTLTAAAWFNDVDAVTYDGTTAQILVGGGTGTLAVWTTATGTGAPVRGTSPSFTTGVVSASTTLAVFNTVATTVNAFGAASVALNIGHASGTNTILGASTFSQGVNGTLGSGTPAAASVTSLTASGTFTLSSNTAAVNVIGGGSAAAGCHLTYIPTFSGTNPIAFQERAVITQTGGTSLAAKMQFGAAGSIALSSGTTALVATLALVEPNISGNAPTRAATLLIQTAPTEGSTSNSAIYVVAGSTDVQALSAAGAVAFSTTLAVTGNTTLTGDLAVNGGDLTTSATTFNLLNATATTLNIGGAATTLAVGAATSATTWTGQSFSLTGANSTNNTALTVANTSNAAAASHAYIDIRVGGTTSTGDPHLRWTIPGGTSWYAGVDNTGDDFYIGSGTTVGSSAVLSMGTSSATITGNFAVTSNFDLFGLAGLGTSSAPSTFVKIAASTTSVSSLRLMHGTAPSVPEDGDMWTTTAGLFVRINGSTVGPLS